MNITQLERRRTTGLYGQTWVQCQRCLHMWDETEPDHTVCGCLDRYGTRQVASVRPQFVQELVNRGFDRV